MEMTDDDSEDTVDTIAFVTESSLSSSSDETEWLSLQDIDLSVDDDLEMHDDSTRIVPPDDREVEMEVSFELETEQTVVCHHCGEVNSVPDAEFLTAVDMDINCTVCGYPLEVIR